MTGSGTGPDGLYTAMADGLRAATESAAALWRSGADALAAQAEAVQRMAVPDPATGVDRYFDLLTQATEANKQLAEQWSEAVRAMTALLAAPGGAPAGLPVPQHAAAGTAASGAQDAEPVPGSAPPTTAATTAEPGAASDDHPPTSEVHSSELVLAGGKAVVGTEPAPAPARTRPARAPRTRKAATPPRTRKAATPEVPAAGTRARDAGATEESTDPRVAFVRMGKAAVSARLAERGLPRTGTLAALVNRLVEAEAAD